MPCVNSLNMSEYRYQLEKYSGMSSRYTCPACRKPKRFTRYIDVESGNHLASHVGRCERIDNCAYHYTPKEYFSDYNIKPERSKDSQAGRKFLTQQQAKTQKLISEIKYSDVKASTLGMTNSTLVQFLYGVFGKTKVDLTISDYLVGQYRIWSSICPVFWQIDKKGKIRTGKVIMYNKKTGKRVKNPRTYINWMHSVLKYKDYNLSQCLYGEHLLHKYPHKVIGLVESEKTVLISSICFDDYLWIATGGKVNMKASKFKVLSDRKVCLFPDLNAYEEWSQKANELSEIIPNITVSDLLKRKASTEDREKGLDLADYILEAKTP